MSQNLYWRPIVPQEEQSLPDALKFKLRDHLQMHQSGPVTVNSSLVCYLHGLADCNVQGAKELIDIIEKYESIELFLQ